MNDPSRDLAEQIRWIGESGLQFLDFTLEPPGAASWEVDPAAVRGLLARYGLKAVGHTAPYLPVAGPIEGLRQAAVAELKRCIQVFQAAGVGLMNIHPNLAPMHSRAVSVEKNLATLRDLLPFAQEHQIVLMVENVPGAFNTAAQLAELLDPLPELGLHLDLGHANLAPQNTTAEILAAHRSRLKHVHLHDNKGGALDLHLPLGAGTLDLAASLRALKSAAYDSTITLEVFSPDRSHILFSRDILLKAWAAA